MFPNVYLFNPDYDMAMANFTPYYKSPAEIMRMIADLSVLPWWFAEEGNCVKVENMALVSLLQKQLREVCGGSMEVERRLDELLPRTAWTAEWPSGRYIPWGWTPALVHRLRQEGVEECFLPSEETVRRFRFLSSRQRCLEVLPELLKIDGTCGEMKACVSLSETGSVSSGKRRIGFESSMVGKWERTAESIFCQLECATGWVGRTYSEGTGSCDGGTHL